MIRHSRLLSTLATRYPWSLRAVTFVVVLAHLEVVSSGLARTETLPEKATEDPRLDHRHTPNRSLPNTSARDDGSVFSDSPSDRQITDSGLFVEALVPAGGRASEKDNRAIVAILKGWRDRRDREDFALLDAFTALHPKSPWTVALLINEGIECRRLGYFSKALEAWGKAWELGRDEKSFKGRALVDRAAGELAELNARLGRYEWLERFFKEIEGRNIGGSATEKIAGARQGLGLMQGHPEDAFRCGPMALDRIRASID